MMRYHLRKHFLREIFCVFLGGGLVIHATLHGSCARDGLPVGGAAEVRRGSCTLRLRNDHRHKQICRGLQLIQCGDFHQIQRVNILWPKSD